MKVSAGSKIARNSFWLVLQPLILNACSLAVTGYMTRVLGQADYGVFVFAMAFTAMFEPLGDMGLRAITVRSLASSPDNPRQIVGRVLVLRSACIVFGYAVLVLVLNLVGYPPVTKNVVYITGLLLIPRAIMTTANDTFEAHERMEYVAIGDGAAGATLTALTVVVLALGLRLYSLATAYLAGRVVGMALACWYLSTRFIKPQLGFDWSYTKTALSKGAVFFYPAFLGTLVGRLGIVFLSKTAGNAAVGLFGAGNDLADRLNIIPEGICAALFPTLVRVHQRSPEEAKTLFRQLFEHVLVLAAPIAVGGFLVAPQIIGLIYGEAFAAATDVFRVAIWWIFLAFFNSMMGWTLAAIHREKIGAYLGLVVNPLLLLFYLVLIPSGKEVGLATAIVLKEIIVFIVLSSVIGRVFVSRLLRPAFVGKVAIASALMGILVFGFTRAVTSNALGVLIAIPAGALIYGAAILVLKIVSPDDLRDLLRHVLRRKSAEAKPMKDES